MSSDDVGRVDDGVTHHAGFVDLVGSDPDSRQPKRRLVGRRAVELALRLSRVDRQLGIRLQLEAGDFGALEQHDVLPRLEGEVIGDANRWQHEAQLGRQLPPHAGNALQQRPPLGRVDQSDKAQADFNRDRFHPQQPVDVLRLARQRRRLRLRFRQSRPVPHVPTQPAHAKPQQQKRNGRQPRDSRHSSQNTGGNQQRLWFQEHLFGEVSSQTRFRGGARCDDAAGNRYQQCRNDRDQAVSDGENRIRFQRFAEAQAVLKRAGQKPSQDVHGRDNDAGDRVALREANRSIHRPIEFGFPCRVLAPLAGLGFVDQSGIEIRINAHLLARQSIEREARRDF